MTDDLFVPLTPPNPAATGRKCPHPRRDRYLTNEVGVMGCGRCGHTFNVEVVRRNRNNRARGGKAELDVARRVGGRKVGPLGHPWDVELPGYMRLQVKKLAKAPSLGLIGQWMDAIPPGQEMRAVALVEPGRGGRRFLVLDLDEFARWHGDPTKGEAA